jgi:hypothetical protein
MLEVRGLKELRRELKLAGAQFPRELGKAHKAAAEVVAKEGRAKASSAGGVVAKAGPGITSSAAQTAARIGIGGAKYPYGPGAVVGSKKYPQFEPYRGPDPESWAAIGPALESSEDRFLEVYGDAVEDLMKRAFPGRSI